MIFTITNGECTVIRTNDDGNYISVGTYPCMWQEVKGYEVKKYGAENADKAAVYIPDITADVQEEDYIIRGTVTPEDFLPENALVITSVSVKDYGGELKHIQIGAR